MKPIQFDSIQPMAPKALSKSSSRKRKPSSDLVSSSPPSTHKLQKTTEKEEKKKPTEKEEKKKPTINVVPKKNDDIVITSDMLSISSDSDSDFSVRVVLYSVLRAFQISNQKEKPKGQNINTSKIEEQKGSASDNSNKENKALSDHSIDSSSNPSLLDRAKLNKRKVAQPINQPYVSNTDMSSSQDVKPVKDSKTQEKNNQEVLKNVNEEVVQQKQDFGRKRKIIIDSDDE